MQVETDVLHKMLQAMAAELTTKFEVMVSTGTACLKVSRSLQTLMHQLFMIAYIQNHAVMQFVTLAAIAYVAHGWSEVWPHCNDSNCKPSHSSS